MNTNKTLTVARHSKKTPDGQGISEEGLELIAKKAGEIIGNMNITKGFHSRHIRTQKTLTHLFAVSGISNVAISMIDGLSPKEPDDAYEEKFEEYMRVYNDTKSAVKSMEIVFGEEAVARYQELCGKGIMECFSQMQPGENAIGVSHTPYISYAAYYLSNHTVPLRELAELDFITFVQHEDGTISIQ